MSITTTTSDIEHSGSGTAPQFYSIPFIWWEDSEIIVEHVHNISAGVATRDTLVDGVNYTLSGGDGSTGLASVTTPIIETDEILIVRRVMPLTQLFNFDKLGGFPSDNAQTVSDQCTAGIQQVQDDKRVTLSALGEGDVFLSTGGVPVQLQPSFADIDITRTTRYNIFCNFIISSANAADTPVDFRVHIGPLGTIVDPNIFKKTVFFPPTADTEFSFPVDWLRIFLSSTQKLSFSATTQFNQLSILEESSMSINEYVEQL